MASVRLAGADFALAGFSCPLYFLSPCVIKNPPKFQCLPLYIVSLLPDISTMPSLLLCFSLVIKVNCASFHKNNSYLYFSVNVHILFLGCFVFSSCRDLRALCI